MEQSEIKGFNDYMVATANEILSATAKIYTFAEMHGRQEIIEEAKKIKATIHNAFLNADEGVMLLHQNVCINDIFQRVINDINALYPSINIGLAIFNKNLVANLDYDLFRRALTNLLLNLFREEKPDKINIAIKNKEDKATVTITTKIKPLIHNFEYKLVMQVLQLLKINIENKSSDKELKYVLEIPLIDEPYLEIGEMA